MRIVRCAIWIDVFLIFGIAEPAIVSIQICISHDLCSELPPTFFHWFELNVEMFSQHNYTCAIAVLQSRLSLAMSDNFFLVGMTATANQMPQWTLTRHRWDKTIDRFVWTIRFYMAYRLWHYKFTMTNKYFNSDFTHVIINICLVCLIRALTKCQHEGRDRDGENMRR